MSEEKAQILTRLSLARFNIKRYLERLKESPRPTNSSKKTNPHPLSTVFSSDNQNTKLDLSGALLTDADFMELLLELKELILITDLDLHGNLISGTSIKELRKILPNLERLNLAGNNLYLNDGCSQLAQYPNLKRLDISNNNLKSADFEKLGESCSLLQVNSSSNNNTDIVRKAKLLAACDYNNMMRVQKGVGATSIKLSKAEYIEKNLKACIQRVTLSEKISADLNYCFQARSSTITSK